MLTGISIHSRGWKSVVCSPDPLAFLGCAPPTYTSTLSQQKRWANGLLEIFFSDNNPLLLTMKENLWFRQAIAYTWLCCWGIRPIPELCYAFLPAYCLITGTHFMPKFDEWAFFIPVGIFVIYNSFVFWECKRLGLSLRMWRNLQRMGRVSTMTSWLFGFLNMLLQLIGLSKNIFEVTQKEHKSSDGDDDTYGEINDKNVARFTYDKSPMIIPGVVVLLVNLAALANGVLRLLKVDYSEIWMEALVLGLGEMFCSVCVLLCFSEFFKGLFRKGKYGIPAPMIWKSGVLALLIVHMFRRSAQSF